MSKRESGLNLRSSSSLTSSVLPATFPFHGLQLIFWPVPGIYPAEKEGRNVGVPAAPEGLGTFFCRCNGGSGVSESESEFGVDSSSSQESDSVFSSTPDLAFGLEWRSEPASDVEFDPGSDSESESVDSGRSLLGTPSSPARLQTVIVDLIVREFRLIAEVVFPAFILDLTLRTFLLVDGGRRVSSSAGGLGD